jgi:hypothetical protein
VGHHTKDKGDLGVAKAHADLLQQGCLVLLPLTEHAPFDLVAYRDGTFARIQVKYRAMSLGAVSVGFRSSWADSHGTHDKLMDKSEVDVVCLYCPETDECYYVQPSAFGRSVTLRIEASRNGQRQRVLQAAAFRSMPTASDLQGAPTLL